VNNLSNSELLNLPVDKIFVYYDGPKFYSTKPLNHVRYLALCVEEAANDQIWIFVAISENRYQKMLNNELTLYDVFKNSESNSVVEITITSSGDVSSREVISQNISESHLPTKNYYLSKGSADQMMSRH
jgi:hypothetical protein